MSSPSTTHEIHWQNIETVLLDMDGTLLDLHFDNYFWQTFLPQQYASQKNLDIQDALNTIERMYEEKHGQLEWYSIDYWQNTLELDIMALKHQEAHRIRYRAHCIEFLEFLLSKDIEPILVTNAHPKSLELKMQICPLEPWIKKRYSSHNFNKAKEHPQFWESFHKTQAFDKTKTLFIDDNDRVLKSADNYGIAWLRSITWPDDTAQIENDSNYIRINHFKDIIDT